jgi:hypothetical protein
VSRTRVVIVGGGVASALEHSVTAAQLRDESVPVKRLAAPARSVTAT